jgi:aminopeptidase N
VKCELLTKKEESFTVPGCATWVLANANAAGYYRSAYGASAFDALSEGFETELSPSERIQTLSDTWAGVRVGLQPISSYLTLTKALAKENNAQVMDQGATQIRFIGDRLVTDADRSSFEQWVRLVLKPAATNLGWTPAANDSDDRKTLRAQVINTLGYSGRDPETLDQARKLAEEELGNSGTIDPTMATTVLNLAALNGDEALYNKILDRMKVAASPGEYYRLLGALERFTNPQLIQRTLEMALTPAIRSQDMPRLFGTVMGTPAGEEITWNFVRSHWQQIDAVQKGYNSGAIVQATGTFCSTQLHDEVQNFFAQHAVPDAQRTLKQSLERIDYCVDLRAQQAKQLASWLGKDGSAAGSN